MPFTFLTRHYPPNSNINGESVCDMVTYLEQEFGLESHVVCIDRNADGVADARKPAGTVHRVAPLYTGQQSILRFLAFFYDGIRLTLKALQWKDHVVVCTTSPPLLPMWGSLLLGRKLRWAVWAFDLFPEGFRVTNFIGPRNPLYRLALWATYQGRPDYIIALGERQAAYLQRAYGREIPTIILPCGVFFYQDQSEIAPDWYDPRYIFLGYCGNLGDPHNPEFVKAVIDNLDPERHRLVLALYGNRAAEVKAYAEGKPGVILVDRVPRQQLHFIGVHLVSLRREWTHIAVPSKAVSAVFMGASILFCGDADSDNWHMLQQAGWLIEEGDDLKAKTATFLANLQASDIEQKRAEAPAIRARLQGYVLEGYRRMSRILE